MFVLTPEPAQKCYNNDIFKQNYSLIDFLYSVLLQKLTKVSVRNG